MMNILKKIKKVPGAEKGSIMIEAVIGLTLVAVGMLGIFNLVSNSVRMNHSVGTRFIAANLAAEGVEVVKNIVDTNIAEGNAWNEGLPSGSYRVDYNSNSLIGMESDPQGCGDSHYLCIDSDGNYNYTAGDPTLFRRTVSITDKGSQDPPEIVVSSTVEWMEGGEVKTLSVEDHFYKWRE